MAFAALISPLVLSGSRKSDGDANASGTVYFYRPGTLTPVSVYADANAETVVSAPLVLDNGGRVNVADYPEGLYSTQPVRLFIQDTDGNTVSDTVFIPASAGNTGVDNDAFPDSTTMDEVLTLLGESTGGTNGNYQESGGAVERSIHDKFQEISISVKDFGAVGDGIADDTLAIQETVDRVIALEGGSVYFPPGTYVTSAAITLNSGTGVSIVGVGPEASIIKGSNTSADCFTVTNCDSFQARGLTVSHVASSTGTAFSLDTCNAPTFEQVVHEGDTSAGWRVALSLTASPSCTVTNCTFEGESSSAAGRGISLGTNSGGLTVVGGRLEAVTGYAFEVSGNSGSCVFVGVQFSTTARFAAGGSGSPFTFVGCSLALSVATTFMPEIKLIASSPLGSATSSATGAAQTPSLVSGFNVELAATSGGAGTVTVNAPAILPVDINGQYWDFTFINAAGGAVTWSLNSVFVVASAIPTTNGHTINVRFWWDPNTSKLREASRADTVT